MKEFYENIKFRINSMPRMTKQVIAGFFFMILGVILSRADPSIYFFIFGACFSLLGLVLFFMGLINGLMDLIKYLRHKKDVTT